MPQRERNTLGHWCMFLLGGLMVSSGALELHRYFTTGHLIHRPSRLLPLHLAGSDAALYYSLYFLAGTFVLAAGIRGLLRK